MRLIRSKGPDYSKGLPDFQFETIPDGLPPSDRDATQDVPALCDSTRKNCLAPFKELVIKLNSTSQVPQVTCIVSDAVMGFGREAGKELGIPEVQFWPASACGFMAGMNFDELIKRGIIPFKGTYVIRLFLFDKACIRTCYLIWCNVGGMDLRINNNENHNSLQIKKTQLLIVGKEEKKNQILGSLFIYLLKTDENTS